MAGTWPKYPRAVTSSAPRLRFAPSPTGYLHVGNARAALFNWLEARRTGGEMLLRVEDTDRERSSSELVENILASLRWLGLDWDGDIVFQADNLDVHREAALVAARPRARPTGATAPASRCRPGPRSAAARPATTASAATAALAQSDATALRFRAPDDGTTSFTDMVRGEVSFENKTIEDFVLLRSTGMPMFLLSNAYDDAEMGITHVVRGEDHVPGTPKYLLLRDALGLGRPEVFAHLPMLVNEGRKKLSKRKDAVSVADFAAEGYLPEAMVNYLALLGWGPKDGVEIRPLERDRRAVPARGRHPVAGLLRREEAPAHQRRVRPRRCRSTSSSSAPRPFLTRGEAALDALDAARRAGAGARARCSPRSSR